MTNIHVIHQSQELSYGTHLGVWQQQKDKENMHTNTVENYVIFREIDALRISKVSQSPRGKYRICCLICGSYILYRYKTPYVCIT